MAPPAFGSVDAKWGTSANCDRMSCGLACDGFDPRETAFHASIGSIGRCEGDNLSQTSPRAKPWLHLHLDVSMTNVAPVPIAAG